MNRRRPGVSTDDVHDADIVTRIQAGSAEAFQAVFLEYAQVLADIAFAYVKRRSVAQELVQDVFCRLWEQRATLAIRVSLRVYLYAAVRHRALDHLKHQRVTTQASEAVYLPGEHPGMGAPLPRADELLIEQERLQLLYAAVEALPERQREVFRLRWEHHLSYAEIAEVTGLSLKGVESARARAIESLQRKLRGVWD
jgi:RNA polymerase sigma-70 factor (ECF subfamily)